MLELHTLSSLVPASLDWPTIATSGAFTGLGCATLLLARSLFKTRGSLTRDLSRIGEQLDLLRHESNVLAPAVAAGMPPALPAGRDLPVLAPAHKARPRALPEVAAVAASAAVGIGEAGDYYTAARLAAGGTSIAEISERCGIVSGEARVLVALEQARARRAGGM
jgi:hypothetical protein